MVELIEASRMAIDELIDILGRASMEAVLQLSARSVAGEKQQGRSGYVSHPVPKASTLLLLGVGLLAGGGAIGRRLGNGKKGRF